MKYALIIGNNKYDDPKLAQLKTPAADSQALAKDWSYGWNVRAASDEDYPTDFSKTVAGSAEAMPLARKTSSRRRKAASRSTTRVACHHG